MASTLTQSKMDTKSFPLFPKLPTEIRIKIWEAYAMLQPRIVEVCLKHDIERPTYDHRNTQFPFYTPTALPSSLFNINQESRSVVIQTYPLSFPNAHHSPQIRWNPSIDTIFFPAWCFQYHVNDFMIAAGVEEKGMIERLAFETLVWYADCDDGRINNYIQIDEFRNLKEVVLVQRLPDHTGCGCCHEFNGPEEGVAGFRDVALRESEGGDGELEEGEIEEAEETEGEVQQTRKRPTMSEDCMEEFARIHERDPGWRIPSVKKMDLTRDGVII